MNDAAKELLKKKNVVLVYTGKKVVGGVETTHMSIRVGVIAKMPLVTKEDWKAFLKEFSKTDVVPKRIKGMETDVFQTEEIKALVDRKSRVRPSPGGVSIGHPNVTAGSQGPVVKKVAVRHILSNKHVLAPDGAAIGDQIWQPGSYDGGGPADTIAHLSDFIPIHFIGDSGCLIPGAIGKVLIFFARLLERVTGACILATPINKVDCAIARPIIDEDVSDEILEIGVLAGFSEAKIGDKVKKSGRTSGFTEGEVIATDGIANVNYGQKIAAFDDQIIITAMSQGGDSGSGVLNQKDEAVGLLFAGSESLTIVNKIANVIDALGLDK